MNRLAQSSSPYLLQHAHNPVDWYPWGEEAFEKARREDKPILVSIGYSTCHWCHVMERESFESEQVAHYMNTHFVNIKVDREERPDVDQIYMDAVQALTRSGGWPLNCFLTPDLKPFWGGTYFPPVPAHNRPSWLQVLRYINQLFKEERDGIEDQARKLQAHIERMDDAFLGELTPLPEGAAQQQDLLDTVYYSIRERFDRMEGGFGSAPKFPGSMSLTFLLRYYGLTANAEALAHVELSLEKMIFGGIYDQLGGGFARYAVDREWLVPHFEKMLYDNALLVSTLSEAYRVTQNPLYKVTINETLAYIAREMHNPQGGWYAAQDADSEGEEGKFYVWSWEELVAVLGQERAAIFGAYYNVTPAGNWEGKNILNREVSIAAFAERHDLPADELERELALDRERLYEVRAQRIPPGRDDKQLLDWNALMVTAYADAAAALGAADYLDVAVQELDGLLKRYTVAGEPASLYHTYKDGTASVGAYLTDYAYLIEAMLAVYKVSQDERWLTMAATYTELVLADFYDAERHLFYFTRAGQSDMIVRKTELYDNATPSGNATMVSNLQALAVLLDNANYRSIAASMLEQMQSGICKYGTSFPKWATALLAEVKGYKEVAVLGAASQEWMHTINSWPLGHYVLSGIRRKATTVLASALLRDKVLLDDAQTLVYVCESYACQAPVSTLEAARKLLLG